MGKKFKSFIFWDLIHWWQGLPWSSPVYAILLVLKEKLTSPVWTMNWSVNCWSPTRAPTVGLWWLYILSVFESSFCFHWKAFWWELNMSVGSPSVMDYSSEGGQRSSAWDWQSWAAPAAVSLSGDPPTQGWPFQTGGHRDGQSPARGNHDVIS